MDLNATFENAVTTIFEVFSSLLKPGKYITKAVDAGWGEVEVPHEHSMDVIVNGLSQDDLKKTTFYTQIQPSDTVVMVKGSDIKLNSIRVLNTDRFSIQFTSYTSEFLIVAHETDPAEALYTILLREVKDVG